VETPEVNRIMVQEWCPSEPSESAFVTVHSIPVVHSAAAQVKLPYIDNFKALLKVKNSIMLSGGRRASKRLNF